MSEGKYQNCEKTAPDTIIHGYASLAQHFGKSERQVRRWVKQGCPVLSGLRFDVLQVQAWLDAKAGIAPAPRTRTPIDPRQLDLAPQRGKDYEDARMKKARADLLELELRKRRGELIEKIEVEQLFVERILAVKQGLLAFARSLPPQLIHCASEREMEEVISREVRALLEAYSRPLPQMGRDSPQGWEAENGGSGAIA